MKITKELLREKGACAAGYRNFLKEFPEKKYPDGVEYQELLDCCAEKNFGYGSWLLSVFGRTDDVRKIDGNLTTEKSIIFAGRLDVSGSIEAGLGIEAGWGIKAGECIKAGLGIEAGWGIKAGASIEAGECIKAGLGIEAGECIKAGWGIKAGRGIKAGCEFGIYAGLRVRITDNRRKIIAKAKPENIMCGEFVEAKNE